MFAAHCVYTHRAAHTRAAHARAAHTRAAHTLFLATLGNTVCVPATVETALPLLHPPDTVYKLGFSRFILIRSRRLLTHT